MGNLPIFASNYNVPTKNGRCHCLQHYVQAKKIQPINYCVRMIMPYRKSLNYKEKYDFSTISDVVTGLEQLKKEATAAGDDDIELIINSAFNLCFSAYYLALRTKLELKGQRSK